MFGLNTGNHFRTIFVCAVLVMMKLHYGWREGAQVVHEAISNTGLIQAFTYQFCIRLDLRLKRSTKPVPNYQNSCVIGVDTVRISAMMHAVMRGRVKDEFQRLWQLVNGFRVNPELVEFEQLIMLGVIFLCERKFFWWNLTGACKFISWWIMY